MNSDEMSDILKKFNNMGGQNNISPDMINNLMGMLNNSSKSDTQNNSNTNPNNAFKSSNFNNQTNSTNNNGIDFETILKMKTGDYNNFNRASFRRDITDCRSCSCHGKWTSVI